MLGLPGMKKQWIGCFINENLYLNENLSVKENLSEDKVSSLNPKNRATRADYKYVRQICFL